MCPSRAEQEEPSPRSGQSWAQANPEAAAEGRRRYREAHPEKIAAAHRAWRERNADRSRELNRESAKRQAHRRQQRLKKNAHSREWYAENREVALERGRRFRAEHPDRVREYQRRYKERHPERVRRFGREGAQRYRDANADAIRERQRLAAAARRKANPNAHREWYEKNLERQRTRSRETARLGRRLKKLGLPPSRVHRLYAEQRRAQDAEADEYFARRRSPDERGVIAAEAVNEQALDIPKVVATRRRVALREQLMPLNREPSEWGASGQDQGLPPEVIQWRRARDLHELKEIHELLIEKIRTERPHMLEHHRERNEARLREEIRLDSIARVLRGLPPYELEKEMNARMNEEVTLVVDQRLRAMRQQTVARAADIVRRHGSGPDAAAPHQVPGAGPDMGRGLR